MVKGKYDLIPASTLKKMEKEIKEFGGEDESLKKLERKIDDLSKEVEKSIKVNVDLQEKVTELMIHLTNLMEDMKTVVEAMGKHSPTKKGTPQELSILAEQNKELTQTLRSLEKQLKKEEIREAIRKALEKVGAMK